MPPLPKEKRVCVPVQVFVYTYIDSTIDFTSAEPTRAWVKTLPAAAYDDEPETVAMVSPLPVTLGSLSRRLCTLPCVRPSSHTAA